MKPVVGDDMEVPEPTLTDLQVHVLAFQLLELCDQLPITTVHNVLNTAKLLLNACNRHQVNAYAFQRGFEGFKRAAAQQA